MNNFLIFLTILFLNFISILSQESRPIVTIPDGQILGVVNQTVGLNKTYYSFRGIPYAQPPVGNLRFADPVKNHPWNGTLNATYDKNWCVQCSPALASLNVPFTVIGSEDCLNINVYTPNLNGSLPVMLWIHGGGYIAGSSAYSERGPDFILDEDVVFVAPNYRLGVFGFLSTGGNAAPGNWGIKDQILALQWAKDNIQYFGGDPEKITIFGESAGGASVAYLLQTNLTKGLYRGAIMDSGHSLCLWSLTRDPLVIVEEFALSVGVVSLNPTDIVSQLREKNASDLKAAENNLTVSTLLTDGALGGLPFSVTTEPKKSNGVLTGKSHQILSDGDYNQVPVLIGHNSFEAGALDAYVDLAMRFLYKYDMEVYKLTPASVTTNVVKKLLAGQDIRNFFCDNSTLSSHPEALSKIVTIDQFNRPIREAVNLYSKFSNAYYYKFSYEGSLGSPDRNYSGVGHAEELNYLFVSSPVENPATEADIRTRHQMVSMWTNFVKYLNPTPNSTDLLDNVIWEPNSPSTNASDTIKYININSTLIMDTNPFQEYWEFYQNIFSKYGDPPYNTF